MHFQLRDSITYTVEAGSSLLHPLPHKGHTNSVFNICQHMIIITDRIMEATADGKIIHHLSLSLFQESVKSVKTISFACCYLCNQSVKLNELNEMPEQRCV